MSAATSTRAPWSLRRRLTLTTAALLVIASLVIGAISVFALRSFLVGRLDQQLNGAVNRSAAAATRENNQNQNQPNRPSRDNDRSQGALLTPGQMPGTLVAVISAGTTVSAGILADNGTVTTLPSASADSLVGVRTTARPSSVDVPNLGEYRVISVTAVTGETYIVGLPMTEVDAATMQLLVVLLTVTVLGVMVAVIIGRSLIRRELRPLDRLVTTATTVSELPLDKGDVELAERLSDGDADPRTEVGRVGNAFNNMLGHISRALTARQASENKVRQFVADASHELRTPLASIRGYAELTRRSGAVIPDDVTRSLGRIESEAIRMTGLVEDLLLLARLDEGRELEQNPTDLSRIVVDSVGDAYAAGPDHVWEVDMPEEPITVIGDAPRLHQVIVNLLANARVHTPAGTEVRVELREQDGSAIVSVIDNGPGIPATQLPTLFERFTRGDESRNRATGSTGLGLAIVTAVVHAHHGQVSVASEPGRTEFRVELPLAGTRLDPTE